jgi:hypothetical protein
MIHEVGRVLTNEQLYYKKNQFRATFDHVTDHFDHVTGHSVVIKDGNRQ